MLFHFQFRFEDRWEAVGSGEGEGIDAPMVALAELNGLTGGSLAVGTYRCIPARAASAYWEYLDLGSDGATRFAEGGEIERETAGEVVAQALSL